MTKKKKMKSIQYGWPWQQKWLEIYRENKIKTKDSLIPDFSYMRCYVCFIFIFNDPMANQPECPTRIFFLLFFLLWIKNMWMRVWFQFICSNIGGIVSRKHVEISFILFFFCLLLVPLKRNSKRVLFFLYATWKIISGVLLFK